MVKDFFDNAFHGHPLQSDMWITPTPSYFMSMSYELSGDLFLYTFGQAFLYFYVLLLFIKKLFGSHYYLAALIFMISPAFYGLSVFYAPSVCSAFGAIAIILIVNFQRNSKNYFDCAVSCYFLFFFSFITFGYRANAFTILPIILVMIFKINKKKFASIMLAASMLLGMFMVSWIPNFIGVNTMSSSSAGFIWEMLYSIQHMDSDKQKDYVDYLDEIGGRGSTAQAMSAQMDLHLNSILDATSFNRGALSARGIPNEILKKYVNLAIKEPMIFLKTKIYFTNMTMGVNQPLCFLGYDYNLGGVMGQYRFNDSEPRQNIVNSCNNAVNCSIFFTRPWIMFLTALILLVLQRKTVYSGKMPSEIEQIEIYSFLTSVFYYGAFILNTQSFEVRYFIPSFLLLITVIAAAIVNIVIFFFENRLKIAVKTIVKYLYKYIPIVGGVALIMWSVQIYISKLNDIQMRINDIEKNCDIVYEDNSSKLAINGATLYYIDFGTTKERRGQTIQIYPMNTLSSNDDPIEIPLNFNGPHFSKSDIAEVNIPSEVLVEKIKVKQTNGSTKAIDISDWFDTIKSFELCNITDNNWIHGSAVYDNILLVESNDIAFEYLAEKEIEVNGFTTKIVKVNKYSVYYHLYTADHMYIDSDYTEVVVKE